MHIDIPCHLLAYPSPMAFNFSLLPLIFLCIQLIISTKTASATTVFTLVNHCPYTVWPGTLSGNSETLGDGGFTLTPGASTKLTAPPGWSGRFWARTHCAFDDAGNGRCATGDCGGLHCAGRGGEPPATLAEFTINTGGAMDFYDVSVVDGFNVGIGVKPTSGGSGECRYAGCSADVNAVCPKELRVTDPSTSVNGGPVVACKSACTAFKTAEYCCTGEYDTSLTCRPTRYSELFKKACPMAYSYAFDDLSGTRTCMGTDYIITFCPRGLY